MHNTFLGRRVVIDLFCAEGPNAKLKRATILEAAKLKLERDIPLPEFNKVTSFYIDEFEMTCHSDFRCTVWPCSKIN